LSNKIIILKKEFDWGQLMQVKNIFRSVWIVLIIGLIQSGNSFGQLTGFRVSGGLSTMEIIGNNIAEYPFVFVKPEGKLYGGSFDQSQNGIRLEAVFPLDTGEIFEIPVGLEYHLFQGREKEWMEYKSDVRLMHDVDVASLTFGINYSFLEIKPFNYKAKFYLGVDTKINYFFNARFKSIAFYYQIKDTVTTIYQTKDPAMRLGGEVLFGLNGELYENINIDFRVGLGLLNLLGKNDDRGELLTPNKLIKSQENEQLYLEPSEGSVFNFHFMMMLQYRL